MADPTDGRVAYEWLVLRVVPRVERGEFVNVGVVVHAVADGYLGVSTALDPARLRALDPAADVDAVARQLAAIEALCAGDASAGPNAARSPRDRFRWLAAPRSTVVQPSATHAGMTDDLDGTLARLLATMVAAPAA